MNDIGLYNVVTINIKKYTGENDQHSVMRFNGCGNVLVIWIACFNGGNKVSG
jgi:hypothetical protein